MALPGWYPDPADPSRLRYFDGNGWTDHVQRTEQSGAGAVAPTAQLPRYEAQLGYETQPGYGTQADYETQAGYGTPGPPGAGAWSPGPTPTAVPPRRRRHGVIAAVVVVVLVAAGAGWWFFIRDDAPELTYQGQEINNPGAVLTATETNLSQYVTDHHGSKSADARCYFAVPEGGRAQAKKTDVSEQVLCGPVLFVDGDTSKEYLAFTGVSPTSSSSGATLTPSKAPARRSRRPGRPTPISSAQTARLPQQGTAA